MLRQIERWVQNGPITKNGVLPGTTLFCWKLCFRLRTSRRVDLMCQLAKCYIRTFCKRWSFIWRCFFPVSFFKRTKLSNTHKIVLDHFVKLALKVLNSNYEILKYLNQRQLINFVHFHSRSYYIMKIYWPLLCQCSN